MSSLRLRQRLRAAPGAARRGGRRRDLPRLASLAGEGVTIFGDGEQTRDYVYVGDVVAGGCSPRSGRLGASFNVGTGIETSVNDLFDGLPR